LLCVIALSWHSSVHAEDKPVILVLGDSLSAAHGIDPKTGWVTLLQEQLNREGYSYTVVNASISGETSGGGSSRLPRLLEKQNPVIVMLELGANDGLRGYPVKILKQNLFTMVEISQQAGAQVLLIGIQIPQNYGGRYNALFENTFITVSEQSNIPLMPTLLGTIPLNTELMQSDRLHPNAKAQPLLLERVWPHLEPLLQK